MGRESRGLGPAEGLLAGRAGLRVVGDVHGEAGPLAAAVAGARAEGLAVLLLGDLVDRGPDSPGAVEVALDLLERGDGDFVPGNHDDKLRRWAAGNPVELSPEALGGTLEQFARRADGTALLGRFAAAVATRPVWRRFGELFAAHAAFDPRMLEALPAPTLAGREHRELRHTALYGETDGRTPEGRRLRSYRWADAIPAGLTVAVGHDILSLEDVLVRRGALGGVAVHLDTGAGTGGRLSWLDVREEGG